MLAPWALYVIGFLQAANAASQPHIFKPYDRVEGCEDQIFQVLANETYSVLTYEEVLAENKTVLYNITAPGAACRPDDYFINKTSYPEYYTEKNMVESLLLSLDSNSTSNVTSLQRRWEFASANARVYFAAIEFMAASALLGLTCSTIYNYVTWRGVAVCVISATMGLMAKAAGLLSSIAQEGVHTEVIQAAYSWWDWSLLDQVRRAIVLFLALVRNGHIRNPNGSILPTKRDILRRAPVPSDGLTARTAHWDILSPLVDMRGDNYTHGHLLAARKDTPIVTASLDAFGKSFEHHLSWLEPNPGGLHLSPVLVVQTLDPEVVEPIRKRALANRDETTSIHNQYVHGSQFVSGKARLAWIGDLYAKKEWWGWGEDMGNESSGNDDSAVGQMEGLMAASFLNRNVRRACLCFRENNVWITTSKVVWLWPADNFSYDLLMCRAPECHSAGADGHPYTPGVK